MTVLASSPSFADLPTNISQYYPEMLNDPSMPKPDFNLVGLPSFLPTYLFLVRIPLDVVHECVRLRLEQRPENEPSLLSVRQVTARFQITLLDPVFSHA